MGDLINDLHLEPIEDYEDDSEGEGEYCDNPPLPSAESIAKAEAAWNRIKVDSGYLVNEDGTRCRHLKSTKSNFVRALIHLDGKNFDFTGRQYLKPIYDRDDAEILLKTARQVEKCVLVGSPVLLANGSETAVQCLTPGTQVVGMGSEGIRSRTKVVASESNGNKPCFRIRTRLGSEITVTHNHPLRTLLDWKKAEDLVVGDKVASLRTLGFFGKKHQCLATMLGLMVGDGSYTENAQRFTAKTPEVHDLVDEHYGECNYSIDKRSGTRNYFISKKSDIYEFLKKNGMVGSVAHEKSLPEEVFSYNEESTRQLLLGLWATDGHCKNVTPSKVDLVFASASEVLVRQVRLLLRKFGIVTTLRTYKPKNSENLAYIIRVVTRRSIEAFFYRIGPIPGKPFSLPSTYSNSNLDTLPKEVHEVIVAERKMVGNYWQRDGLMSAGMRINRAYCPTFEKVSKLNEVIGSPVLQKTLDADIIWDEITSIEDVGEQPTWALQTEDETFVSDFIVNHNTTFLANNIVIDSVVLNYNKSLYVSPSHTQTRQFSSEKLKPAIERSPLIKTYFQDSSVSQQVFEKGFTNGAFVFLRSAFRSADRARGVSARNLALDEIQDMLIDQIPVIRECTSHFLDARTLMAGTPKSLNNPIEVFWKSSSQNEWLVPCEHCRKWNFLDEKNIAPTELYVEDKLPPGPVCKFCEKPLDITKGHWVSFNKKSPVMGYRIPQLMVPWICGIKSQWLKLLWKRDNYPISQFYNEVLGISYDSALAPVTQDELMQISGEYEMWDLDNLTKEQIRFARGNYVTGGIDWGEGLDGSEKFPSGKVRSASYSVLTIGYYHTPDQYKVLGIKKFVGKEADPDFVVNYCARVVKTLGIQLVGVDWGHGWMANNALVRLIGPKHVVQFQYLAKLKEKLKFDPVGFRYHLQRNFLMSEFFYDLKKAHVLFPKWSHFQPFAKDILAIYAEYNEFRREIRYDHRPSEPDDFYHSCLFAKLACDIMLGKTRRYTMRSNPSHEY